MPRHRHPSGLRHYIRQRHRARTAPQAPPQASQQSFDASPGWRRESIRVLVHLRTIAPSSGADTCPVTLVSDGKRPEIRHLCFAACRSSVRQRACSGPKSPDAPEPFRRLREREVLTSVPSEDDLFVQLSEPLVVNGRSVRYRFARQKARYLSGELRELVLSN